MAGRSRLRAAKLTGSFAGYSQLSARGTRVGKQVSDAILNIFDQFEDATPEIMLEAMQPTFEKSQLYTPVDTGALQESGYLEIIGHGKNAIVQIGYGKGGRPDYTVYVHEAVDIPHRAPGRAKFLQSAVMEDLGQIYANLGLGYKRFMGAS